MSLDKWVFGDPMPCTTADGRHVFYRVTGERTKQECDGVSVPIDASGMLALPVSGEGASPDAALADAMDKATRQDDENRDRMGEIQASIMRSGWQR